MTGACRLLWPPLVVIDASCEAPWALSLVDAAKIQQKATFCNSLFGLRAKKCPYFNIYTENQAVTKPLNISHLKKESVSFLSKSFLSFSKNKNTFHLYKEYIYINIYLYIYILYRTFFHFQNRKWQKWLWQKWQG